MLNFQDTGFKQESLRSYIKKGFILQYVSHWCRQALCYFLGGIELELGDRLGTVLC